VGCFEKGVQKALSDNHIRFPLCAGADADRLLIQ
jgi:hypothetical protein